jgi:hypothetical protein
MRVAEAAAPKPLTPQRQKMKDCGAKWQEEKAKNRRERRYGLQKIHQRVPEEKHPPELALPAKPIRRGL